MKIPKKLPFWVIARHKMGIGHEPAKERLFLIVSDEKGDSAKWWGHLVSTRRLYSDESPYEMYKLILTGNYGFENEEIIAGRQPTEAQIEYGKKILDKWKEKKLIEDI